MYVQTKIEFVAIYLMWTSIEEASHFTSRQSLQYVSWISKNNWSLVDRRDVQIRARTCWWPGDIRSARMAPRPKWTAAVAQLSLLNGLADRTAYLSEPRRIIQPASSHPICGLLQSGRPTEINSEKKLYSLQGDVLHGPYILYGLSLYQTQVCHSVHERLSAGGRSVRY